MQIDLSLVDRKQVEELFETKIEPPVEKGWIIFWKQKQIKAIDSHKSIFPSKKAALDSLLRNINLAHIFPEYMESKLGFTEDEYNFNFKSGYKSLKNREIALQLRDLSYRILPEYIKIWEADGTLEFREV